MGRKSDLGIDAGKAEFVPDGRATGAEVRGIVTPPVVVEGSLEGGNG